MNSFNNVSDEVKKMNECNHLFVKFKDGVLVNLGHTSDCYYDAPIVQCVHCGLTNKYVAEEELDKMYNLYTDPIKKIYNQVFFEQYGSAYRKGKYFDESVLNVISEDVLKVGNYYFCDPVSLYDSAKKVNQSSDNSELFKTMVELYNNSKNKGMQKVK